MVSVLMAAHAALALIAVPLGGYVLSAPRKGDAVHRIAGRTWVAIMAYVVATSLFIGTLEGWPSYLLLGLSLFTAFSLTRGILATRRHDRTGHKANMIGTYIGLCVAAVIALAHPDRASRQFITTHPMAALFITGGILVATVVLVAAARRAARWSKSRRTRTV